VVVAVDLDEANVSEVSFADHAVARVYQMRRAAALHADLHDAFVLARRRMHRLPLDDIHAQGFLDPDIGTRPHRFDHRQRMPVIRRDDKHDVEVALAQHLAIVGEGARRLARYLTRGNECRRIGQHVSIHVAQRHDLDRRNLDQAQQIGLAVPTSADEADPFATLGKLLGVGRPARHGEQDGACLDEVATIHDGSPARFYVKGNPQRNRPALRVPRVPRYRRGWMVAHSLAPIVSSPW
jgi:hypothetical protein